MTRIHFIWIALGSRNNPPEWRRWVVSCAMKCESHCQRLTSVAFERQVTDCENAFSELTRSTNNIQAGCPPVSDCTLCYRKYTAKLFRYSKFLQELHYRIAFWRFCPSVRHIRGLWQNSWTRVPHRGTSLLLLHYNIRYIINLPV